MPAMPSDSCERAIETPARERQAQAKRESGSSNRRLPQRFQDWASDLTDPLSRSSQPGGPLNTRIAIPLVRRRRNASLPAATLPERYPIAAVEQGCGAIYLASAHGQGRHANATAAGKTPEHNNVWGRRGPRLPQTDGHAMDLRRRARPCGRRGHVSQTGSSPKRAPINRAISTPTSMYMTPRLPSSMMSTSATAVET